MPDDAQLLRLYAEEKSEAAFAELVQRHLDLVYSAALRQVGGDAHRAHDVVQTVFTVLACKAATVARHPVLVGWLYTSTQHAAAKVRRAEARRRTREHEAQLMHELTSSDSPPVDWAQLSPLLDEAMRALNDRDREAVLLRFFARRPFAEVGEALRVSEDAARMRVDRALEKLRAQLARRGVTSTGTALGVLLANQATAAAPAGLAGSVVTTAVAATAGMATGAGTGLVTGILAFMSTGKIVMSVAIVCAVAGIGGALYQAREVSRANESVVVALRDREAAETKARSLAAKLREAEESARSTAAQIATLEAERTAAKKAVSEADRGKPAAATPSATSSVWTKPGYAKLYVDRYRASLGLRYGSLYRALNLSPEQAAKFEAILTEHQQGLVDVWSASESRGLDTSGDTPTATAVARLTTEPAKRKADDLLNLLGLEGSQRLKEFDKTSVSREPVAALASSVYASDTPLTARQGDGLTAIIAANTQQVRTPMAGSGPDRMTRIDEVTDWSAVLTQAKPLLSAAQYAAFHAVTEQKRLDREMNKVLGR